MLGKLNKEQIDNILHSQVICRIACSDGKMPYVVPISFYYDGKFIYCQTEEGKKLSIMRKNPNVCIQTDIINSTSNYQSVIVYGKFEELKPEASEKIKKEMHERIINMMSRSRVHKFEHDTESLITENKSHELIMFRIKISEINGRFENQTQNVMNVNKKTDS
jgi:nitroimidazol reductase NimA-like FMN-containing flavoprotein (pyridoxamine 5'-phosphate oxidase superfamily)